MSVQAMSDVLEHSPFSGATFLVHLLIADTVNEQHEYEFFQSQDNLARKCRLTSRSVRRSLTELTEAGYLEVVRRPGRYDAVVYRFRFHADVTARADRMSTLEEESERTLRPNERKSCPDERTQCPTNPIEQKRTQQGRTNKSSAAFEHPAAKRWWEAQDPKPAGKRAWISLVQVCRAASEVGWTDDQILTALTRIASVPSVAQLDRELRNPRPETWSEKKAREEREERDRIEARRIQQEQEAEERRRRWDEDAKNAVPPPPEFREAVAKLRARSA